MSNRDSRQASANIRCDNMTVGGRHGVVASQQSDQQQQTQPSQERVQVSVNSPSSESRSLGPISPPLGTASSSASSFVFPVRSVFVNMQQSRGNPTSTQGASLSRMASNASNLSNRYDRSQSLTTSDDGAEMIRGHAESITQMLESASHSKLPQGPPAQRFQAGIGGQKGLAPPSPHSESSGAVTERIYSAPLHRDGEQPPSASYFNLKGRRSSDGSTNKSPNVDASRVPSRSPVMAESTYHAHGQVDPVPQEARAPGLQTTERCSPGTTDSNHVYRFSDRPGVDREANEESTTIPSGNSPSTTDAQKRKHLKRDDDRADIPLVKSPKGGGGQSVEVTEVQIPMHQTHEPTEPDVGPAINPTTDMTDIVRLGNIGDGSKSSMNGKSENIGQNQRPSVNRHQSVDHQQSVRNFVNKQAETVNMPDPNAPTPTPEDDEGPDDYRRASRSLHRSSNKVTAVDGDFRFESPDLGSDSEESDLDGNDTREDPNRQVTVRDSESESQLSANTADEPVMTVRFEHVTTEDGHHVVVGREGKLQKCEDEPITIPGAVQGFGVLMVLDEDDETGDLSVRQVSENSTELLGLSPRYLFRLQCFTHILPKSQDDALRDNIDYLADPGYDSSDLTDEGPQVFLLSGYGEPGSDDSDEVPTSRTINRRREWTCWVAAHRPAQKSWSKKDKSGRPVPQPNLIVLEFELERDIYNPLYPPTVPEYESEVSSPASGAASAATGSTATMGSGSLDNTSAGETSRASKSTGVSTQTDTTPAAGAEIQSTAYNPTVQTIPSEDSTIKRKRARNQLMGLEGEEMDMDPAHILESTTSHARPLRALERMRRMTRNAVTDGGNASDPENAMGGGGGGQRRRTRRKGPGSGGVGTMDVFAVLAQINDQLGSAPDLETFLKIVVGVIKDLTQFHRCLVYSFDAQWNGQVVAELVDWSKTHDLYKGLMFPMTDIPAQARELYRINKVRLLYDRAQTTARLVLRSKEDLDFPLDMTHSYLRAMSPIHLVYLRNMGVRSSMSISIMAFGSLWGLIACHAYGNAGMRVSFPVRQMLKLLSDSISRNIERLSYAARLRTRKLISTIPTDAHPTGYIVSNADDLIQLFDADSGVLVIGDGAKILGPRTEQSQEILYIAEFLRLKRYEQMQISHNLAEDFPELNNPKNLEVISGLLYVPLSAGGNDFIAFLRKGQLREVHWAGKPYKEAQEHGANLEPRQSFKAWSETIKGRSRAWTDEQLETAGVLALVYGKFIEVWRQKESAMRTNQMTSILLNNASHEVRTPLNHIINYLELALDGQLDTETRENLSRSHMASKSLLFTINDLLDLTRVESGNETAFNDPFDLRQCISDATRIYESEAKRRNLQFIVNVSAAPECLVLGDHKKIRTVVANLVANAVKYTTEGQIRIDCRTRTESESGRSVPVAENMVDVQITVSDSGCGIPREKLEGMFMTFEQADTENSQPTGLGLGLAVVARIVEQLGGQLRAESEIDVGTRFFFSLAMTRFNSTASTASATTVSKGAKVPASPRSRSGSGSVVSTKSKDSGNSEIDTFVQAFGQSHMLRANEGSQDPRVREAEARMNQPGTFPVADSSWPVRPTKPDLDSMQIDPSVLLNAAAGDSMQKRIKLGGEDSRVPPAENRRAVKQGVHAEDKAHEPSPDTAAKPSPPKKMSTSSKQIAGEIKAQHKLRILVVEDDDVNRRILERRLKLDGHTVMSEINGQDAVDLIKRDQAFDCILMDIQMPVMDGKQAATAIRKYEELLDPDTTTAPARRVDNRIPIIAVSATLLESQHVELAVNFDGWMLKPIDFKRMLHILAGISESEKRAVDAYQRGQWERGGWLNA